MLSIDKGVELDGGVTAEVVEVQGNRATRVRLTISSPLSEDSSDDVDSESA